MRPSPSPRPVRRLGRRILVGIVGALASLIGIFAVGVIWPLSLPAPPRDTSPLAIRQSTVVDVETGELRTQQTILIADGRIATIGGDDSVVVPAGTRVVDAAGAYAIPGLWDMHAHVTAITPWLDLPLYVAAGVTNVRDMLGCPAEGDPFIACPSDKRRWTEEAARGARVGPRIVASASFMANGPVTLERVRGVPTYFATRTADEARAFVQHAKRSGADMVKVYDRIPADAYRALIVEARRLGLPVVGHRPHAISTLEAVAGMRSLEHARFLLHDAWPGASALRAAAARGERFREDRRAMVDRHHAPMADTILAAMRESGTAYVPTHLTRWADAYADDPRVRDDTLLRYVHPLLEWQWREDLDATLAGDSTEGARRAYRDFHATGLALTGAAHRAGVQVLAGTDYLVGGLTLHRELALLVEGGLSPLESLRAATLEPARWFGRGDRAGRLVSGADGDVVLLDADPLVDISNTARIRAVVMGGRLYDHAALAALHEHVRGSARSWTIGAKILWRFVANPQSY